ncbi:nuclear transport factor 2 family protein [uncultured Paracoccus sp.]|uniref:nuclear transport factor 2 family protein n=1 Tax=uncultured Paracoccus sp. TaxID=189685 RepID=UPI002623D350|nr:nuclear transport factor 2 family protein [uncultured Paracoccus sp.]
MEQAVRTLFARYEDFFNRSLAGEIDLDEGSSLYASDFIAASPSGVITGRNDEQLRQVMAQGFERYRAIGTTGMRVRDVRIAPIDDLHCVAHVAWTASYARDDLPATTVDFDVHYLVQVLDGAAKVFGWIAGDEEAVLRQHGIL